MREAERSGAARQAAEEAELDRLLESLARTSDADDAALGEDFLSRLEADALEAMPAAPAPSARRAPAQGRRAGAAWGNFAAWIDALGGWPALGSLGAAAVAGLWIGAAPPAALAGYLGGTVNVDLLPDDLSILEE